MLIKTIHIVSFALSIFALIFMVFLRDTTIYLAYGYDPSIIGDNTVIAYEAIRRTYAAMRVTYYITLALTVISSVTGCLAVYRKETLPFYLTHIAVITTLLLSFLYVVALVIAEVIPRRSF